MASAWRVLTFFLIVFVVPVVLIAIPLYARYTLYPTRKMALAASDTIDLHSMASSFWCQGQRVNANGTFDAYLLPKAPRLNRKRRRSVTASSIMTITEDFPEIKRMHLLKGSTFRLSSCSRWPGGTLIVVRGEENLRRCYYKEDADQDDYAMWQRNLAAAANDLAKKNGNPTLNPKHNPVKAKKQGVLPPTNADVFGDYPSNGGEQFELDEGSDDLDLKLTTKKSEDVGKGSKPLDDLVQIQTKNPVDENVIEENDIDAIKSETPSQTSEKTDSNNSTKSPMAKRSINFWSDDIDGSDEFRIKEADAMRKLGFLHTVNDTRDVSAGNSSISSSEEFMEQCKSTILYVDIKSMVDCQQQDLNQDTQDHWFFKINATDNYYFIFMSDNSLEENVVKYYLEVDRVMYNISSNTDACTNSTECVFPISFLSSESVVVELVEQQNSLTSEPFSHLESFEMQAVCQPRVAVYMVFILMVPFIILMFAFQ